MHRIGMTHLFDGIFDIVHSDFIPKPERGPYEKFIAEHKLTRQARRHVRGHCPQSGSARMIWA